MRALGGKGSLLDRSRDSLARNIADFVRQTGYGIGGGMIPADMTFTQWCEELGAKGLKVDGKPFTLDNRPALRAIYDLIPTHRSDCWRKIIVIQKAAQLGLTVWEVLADLYMAIKFPPLTIGMFLPDQSTAAYKSENRFMRIVRTVPDIYHQMIYRVLDGEDKAKKVGEGNVLTRVLGESTFLFLWSSGKVTTESRPMDVVSLDEVQGMTLEQIDKIRERMSASDVRLLLMLSTANMPDLDINFWYRGGTQEVWHSECQHCGTKTDLSDPATVFPKEVIAFNVGQIEGAPINEYVWICPSCHGWIDDPQRGEYIAQNPLAPYRSFMLPQTISPTISAGEMIQDWNRAVGGDQKKTFYNRKLARAYIDADQLPVTMAHCNAAVAEGARAGVQWKTSVARGAQTYMGIDQMGGFNAVIIKERLPDGRQATIHVEAVFGEDPFERCSEMMRDYRIDVCVVEQLPNVNDARRFANRHEGRVFLAGYANLRDDMMQWGDVYTTSDRKTDLDSRSRYTVTLQQYKAMQASLFRIRNLNCLFPPPDELEQDVLERGEKKRIVILRDWVFLHFTKTALVVEQDEMTRKLKPAVVKVGLDPHYSFANMLCDVAWARNWGVTTMMLPEDRDAPQTERAQAITESMPGLPQNVVRMLDDLPAGVCGRCSAFDAGLCTERNLTVGAKDPGCVLYDAVDDG